MLDQNNFWSNVAKNKHKIYDLSDALRWALIYQVGGFFSDLDSLTISDLTKLKNVIGQTNKPNQSPHCAAGKVED